MLSFKLKIGHLQLLFPVILFQKNNSSALSHFKAKYFVSNCNLIQNIQILNQVKRKKVLRGITLKSAYYTSSKKSSLNGKAEDGDKMENLINYYFTRFILLEHRDFRPWY